jgi:tRNA(adenine34) deaminase
MNLSKDECHKQENEQGAERDVRFMLLALKQARQAAAIGEVPIGAVVVCEDVVVATGFNRREIDRDPTAHAEHVAIRQAARALDRWRLSGCTVYVTLEPCLMCAGLMHQARIDRCVYATPDPKAGALGTLYHVHADERLNHRFEVTSGVCKAQSTALLRSFFADLRRKKSGEMQ